MIGIMMDRTITYNDGYNDGYNMTSLLSTKVIGGTIWIMMGIMMGIIMMMKQYFSEGLKKPTGYNGTDYNPINPW